MKYFLLVLFGVFNLTISFAQASDLFAVSGSFDTVLETLADQHIIGSREYFRPEELVNRSEALTMILRAQRTEYLRDLRLTGPWKDVSASAWYAKSVMIATQLGVVVPKEDAIFMPDRPVSRAEFLVMLYRLKNTVSTTSDTDLRTGKFVDVHPTDWYFSASSWAKGTFLRNVVRLDTQLAPHALMTRKEAALWLYAYWLNFEGPSSDLWMRPFGDIVVQTGVFPATPAENRSVSFEGQALHYLEQEANVYKEMTPRQLLSMPFVVPSTLKDLVPWMQSGFVFDQLDLELHNVEGRAVSLHMNPRADTLDISIPAMRAQTKDRQVGIYRFLKEIGVDTKRLEKPKSYDEEWVSFPKIVDGVPVYSLSDDPVSEMRVTEGFAQLPLRQLSLRGQYRARSWEDVLSTAKMEGGIYACPLKVEAMDWRDAKEEVLRCDLRFVDAVPVYVRTEKTDKGESFLLPAVRFTGNVERVLDSGEVQRKPATYTVLRVGDRRS